MLKDLKKKEKHTWDNDDARRRLRNANIWIFNELGSVLMQIREHFENQWLWHGIEFEVDE